MRRGEVDQAHPRAHGCLAQAGHVGAGGGQHRQAPRDQPDVDLAVPVEHVHAQQFLHPAAQAQREHSGGVGGQPRRQIGVDHDHAARRSAPQGRDRWKGVRIFVGHNART